MNIPDQHRRSDPHRPHADFNASVHVPPYAGVVPPLDRAQGYVRPFRTTVRHVGRPDPGNLRELTTEELAEFKDPACRIQDLGNGEECVWSPERLAEMVGCDQAFSLDAVIAQGLARHVTSPPQLRCGACHKTVDLDAFIWAGTIERTGT